ncbi:ester cyclase [Aureivirga sp. CE67]|uniref:ester cyclase n=1 Tax=Aureivirga sp. CE67 TaxID=1788983 RepID=UPI0018CBCE8D|nr:ester cyclase [Aureivirga sp. CE67]
MASKKLEIVKSLVEEVFVKDNPDYMNEICTDDMESHFIIDELDKHDVDGIKTLNAILNQCFSNLKVEIEELFGEKDKVVLVLKFSGTHDKECFLGMKPKGKKIEFLTYDVFYFRKNLISFNRGITDVIHKLDMLE